MFDVRSPQHFSHRASDPYRSLADASSDRNLSTRNNGVSALSHCFRSPYGIRGELRRTPKFRRIPGTVYLIGPPKKKARAVVPDLPEEHQPICRLPPARTIFLHACNLPWRQGSLTVSIWLRPVWLRYARGSSAWLAAGQAPSPKIRYFHTDFPCSTCVKLVKLCLPAPQPGGGTILPAQQCNRCNTPRRPEARRG